MLSAYLVSFFWLSTLHELSQWILTIPGGKHYYCCLHYFINEETEESSGYSPRLLSNNLHFV